jgi:hypothetical protein
VASSVFNNLMRRCVRLKHGRTFDGQRLHLVVAVEAGKRPGI